MVGLDAYMLMRYINICCKTSLFLMFWGLVVLVPVYSNGSQGCVAWNQFTLANIPDPSVNAIEAERLWFPVVFAYLFTAYFCRLVYAEYNNFMEKRVDFLIHGDANTPPQTYYTVMVERVPSKLQSVPKLTEFFNKLFPGKLM